MKTAGMILAFMVVVVIGIYVASNSFTSCSHNEIIVTKTKDSIIYRPGIHIHDTIKAVRKIYIPVYLANDSGKIDTTEIFAIIQERDSLAMILEKGKVTVNNCIDTILKANKDTLSLCYDEAVRAFTKIDIRQKPDSVRIQNVYITKIEKPSLLGLGQTVDEIIMFLLGFLAGHYIR